MDKTIERILSLIENSGLTDKEILRKLDVSTSSTLISDWRKGRSKSPQIKHITKIADIFNVSTDWLLTGEKKYNLSSSESEWLNLYNQLTPEEQQHCLRFIKGYIELGKK